MITTGNERLKARPTFAAIDTGAIRHNYGELRGFLGGASRMMAVVKANAYGHGDIEVSRVLESEGCEYLGVAVAAEGVRLREGGISCPIVVLGGVYPEEIPAVFEFDLTPVVFDMDSARLLDAAASGVGSTLAVHVKIDTGMGRLGLFPAEAAAFFEAFRGLANLELEGVLSHLAESDADDKSFSRRQLEIFLDTLEVVRRAGFAPDIVDISNSAAVVEMPETHLSLVRPGIMLYGSYPSERLRSMIALRPAMELKTRVVQVKSFPKGSPVSYGRTFVTERDSRIAVLPIGYGDGLPRRLSNNGDVLVRGRRAPVAGLVCMDFTMVDVTDIEGARAGDEAVVIGSQGGERITAEEVADRAGTISYEIFCNVSPRVPRVYK